MAFTQIMAIWTRGISMQDHLKNGNIISKFNDRLILASCIFLSYHDATNEIYESHYIGYIDQEKKLVTLYI